MFVRDSRAELTEKQRRRPIVHSTTSHGFETADSCSDPSGSFRFATAFEYFSSTLELGDASRVSTKSHFIVQYNPLHVPRDR